jgi:predicted heme/steroid binding protein
MGEVRGFLSRVYDLAENFVYSYQFRVCLHEIQMEYDKIASKHSANLSDVLGKEVKPNELSNYYEINIYDIYSWLDKIVYRINFTENRDLIMNWSDKQPLKDLKLTIISSKIRLRHQNNMPDWTIWNNNLSHHEYLQNVIKNQSDYRDCYKAVLRQTCFIHNCNTAKYLYDINLSKIFSKNGNELDLYEEKKAIQDAINNQQSHIDSLIAAFHLIGVYEAPRMVHAEYALRTLEAKNLLFKDYSSDAEKIIHRLVLEAYMGDCYREIV